MMRTILALYADWKMADAVVEVLLDQGISHTNIFLKSGDAWQDEVMSYGGQPILGSDLPSTSGQEVLIKVSAPGGELARIAQERILRSCPLSMLERSEERPEGLVAAFTQVFYVQGTIH